MSDKKYIYPKFLRLLHWDYSWPGYYFVTICADMKNPVFGKIVDDEMVLNESGETVERIWNEIPSHFSGVEVDTFVVMPNHIHGIIIILGDEDGCELGLATHASPLRKSGESSSRGPHGPKRRSLGSIVGSFKSAVTREINIQQGTPGTSVWQRNYY